MLFALLLLTALGFLESWQFAHGVTSQSHATSIDFTAPAPHAAPLGLSFEGPNWFEATEAFALILCCALAFLGYQLRRRAVREAHGKVTTEVALEMRVEERTRELRQEVETRQRIELQNRSHKQVLEMLSDPHTVRTSEILEFLVNNTAMHSQGWICALHLMDENDHKLHLAANSEVSNKLLSYLERVGMEYTSSPECQACASGEMHISEQIESLDLGWSDRLAASGVHSVCSIPFSAKGSSTLAGVVTVYTHHREALSASDIEFVESAARLAGLVVEHRRLHSELIQSAFQDSVTGLPNRRAGEKAMDDALELAARRGEALAVISIDINRFKRTIDQYGQATSDHVLRVVAERIRRNPVSTGAVARMGPDEFLVLVPGTTDSLDLIEIARRLESDIARPIYAGSSKIGIAASVGACLYPRDGADVATLERNAELAVSRARTIGEGYCVFSPAMRDEVGESRQIEEALNVALEKNYLRLVYQPIYTTEGELTGFEALLRFLHPRLGNVSPVRFIPIAEESRLIVPIGTWVLREACHQLRSWLDAGLPPVHMSVNISALQIGRDDFADTVASILTESNLAPEHLVLELTESVVMEDYSIVVRQMNLLRQCGVHIAMDDFGTGYSSLSYIHRIPVDTIKIDRSFIEKLAEPEGTRPIVEAVIAMAKHLDLAVVAEGVETAEQRQILQRAGCDGLQGYLFAKPLTPDEAGLCLRQSLNARFASSVDAAGDDLAVA